MAKARNPQANKFYKLRDGRILTTDQYMGIWKKGRTVAPSAKQREQLGITVIAWKARTNPATGYGVIGTGGFKNATEAALTLMKKYGKHALGYARDYYTVASRVADKKFWNVVYNFIYDEMEGVQTNPRRKAKRKVRRRA
jgi:hypothetical protein